jgi:RsiW-degrading membrane proteinase PrsW (M82 family)
MYYVVRNSQQFGPYSVDALKSYVEEGKILLADQIMSSNTNKKETVREIFSQNKITVNIANAGNIAQQIKQIGKDLITPSLHFIKKDLLKDHKVIYLAFIGLAPAFLITFTLSSYFTFYAIALYFSIIWGVFFFFIFKTKQVDGKKTILLFFTTQVAAFVLTNVQNFPPMSYLYALTESNSLFWQMIGYIFGVGFTEELIKALPLFYFVRTAKEPLIPQTLVYYGLISGIGFGVLEGVLYQTTTNTTLGYNHAFFMNIARVTSLPFLHAIWTGIAGYFIAFANLFPKFRKALYLFTIAIPAILHGIYDTLGWGLLGLSSTLFSVLLLMFYLKKSSDYQNKLITIK